MALRCGPGTVCRQLPPGPDRRPPHLHPLRQQRLQHSPLLIREISPPHEPRSSTAQDPYTAEETTLPRYASSRGRSAPPAGVPRTAEPHRAGCTGGSVEPACAAGAGGRVERDPAARESGARSRCCCPSNRAPRTLASPLENSALPKSIPPPENPVPRNGGTHPTRLLANPSRHRWQEVVSGSQDRSCPATGCLHVLARQNLRFVGYPKQFRRPAVCPVGWVGFVVAVGCSGFGPRLDQVVDDETRAAKDPDPVAVGELIARRAVAFGDGVQPEEVLLQRRRHTAAAFVVASFEPRR